MASGSEDGEVLVWDVSTKEVLWRGKAHTKVVLSLDFQRGKDGKGMLVSAGLDRKIKLWEECDEVDEVDAVDDEPVLLDGDDGVDAADENIKRLRLDEKEDDVMIEGMVEPETEPE